MGVIGVSETDVVCMGRGRGWTSPPPMYLVTRREENDGHMRKVEPSNVSRARVRMCRKGAQRRSTARLVELGEI